MAEQRSDDATHDLPDVEVTVGNSGVGYAFMQMNMGTSIRPMADVPAAELEHAEPGSETPKQA